MLGEFTNNHRDIMVILIGICYGMVNLAFQTNSYFYGIHDQ